jgi:hypothetical protein
LILNSDYELASIFNLTLQVSLWVEFRLFPKKLPREIKKETFEEILLEALDEALSTLGEKVKHAVYLHLDSRFNIERNEIPNRLTEFITSIEKIFGLATPHLEILIMKTLNEHLSLTGNWTPIQSNSPEITFQKYLQLMKQKFEEHQVRQDFLEVAVFYIEDQESVQKNPQKNKFKNQ